MAEARLRLILDVEKVEKARRVLNRILPLLDAEAASLQAYEKGGFEAWLTLRLAPKDWSGQVLNAIALAQTFGYGWSLFGDIRDSLEMTAREFAIPGLKFACLTLERAR